MDVNASAEQEHFLTMQWSSKSQGWKPGFGKQTIPPVLLSQLLNDADSQPCFQWFSRALLIQPTSIATYCLQVSVIQKGS